MQTVPSTEAVLRLRYAIVVSIRLLAFIAAAGWFTYTVVLLAHWAFFDTNRAMVAAGFARPDPIADSIVLAAIPAVVLLALAFAARKLLVLVAPIPSVGCPFCSHNALPETGDRCVECGQHLPAAMLTRARD